MDCLSEHGIAEFAEGRVGEEERDRIEAHLDACSDCARLVVEFARVFSDRPREETLGEATRPDPDQSAVAIADDAVLRAGTCVGRYRVLECIGRGGMGVVYGAYDPELDRRVALKLLRGRAARDGRRNARLLREAQAMARLSHPNVITVHDVGTHVREGDASGLPLVYVAMEFVHGTTLSAWLAETKREWAELRAVCVAAGRGLEAAHAAGLVHRDFKPDNVLVGEDGRVRVTDFGLARFFEVTSIDDDGPPSLPTTAVTLATRTGTVLGTPAYMAPEQYGGGNVGPASDQFSFCVTVFEAIYGVRPFAGRTFAELAANVEIGSVRTISSGIDVPSRVHAALVRGLAADPTKRFPDMTALLAELDEERRVTVRRASIVALPLAVGLVAWAAVAPPSLQAIAFCRDDEALDVEWSGTRRAALHEALAGSGVVYAGSTADAVAQRLDGWVQEWSSARAELCARTDALAGDPEVDTVLRAQCLRRGRVAFEASLEVLTDARPEAVRQALARTESLADPQACARAELGEPPPEPPTEAAEAVARARDRLARVETLLWAARFADADAEVALARAEADAIGFAPLVAEVALFEGRALLGRGEADAGARKVEDAAWAAVEARDRHAAVRAFSALVHAQGVGREDIEPARQAVRAARAELRALGGDAWLEANLLLNEGAAEFTASNFEGARRAYETALATGAFETRPMSHADLLLNLGAVSSELHEFDDAIAAIERARAMYEGEAGPHHPSVASAEFNLGATYYRKGEYAVAIQHIERASAIEVETLGARHPTHANTLGSLGVALVAEGRDDEAVAPLQEAIAILEAGADPGDSTLALQRVNLASALFESGRVSEAEASCQRGHRDLLARVGPDNVAVASAVSLLAMIDRAQGELESAEAHARRALAVRSALFPPTHGDLVYTQVGLAEIVAERGRADEALELLDAIVARHPDDAVAPEELAFARFLAARLRLDRGGDAGPARRELASAVERLRTFDDAERRAEAEAWLRDHPDLAR